MKILHRYFFFYSYDAEAIPSFDEVHGLHAPTIDARVDARLAASQCLLDAGGVTLQGLREHLRTHVGDLAAAGTFGLVPGRSGDLRFGLRADSLSPLEHRLQMCRLAFGRLGSRAHVVDLESALPKPSYTVETLRALHQAHLLAVPFENLDIHLGRPIVLDEAAFFRKIVERQRGGGRPPSFRVSIRVCGPEALSPCHGPFRSDSTT